MAKAPLTAALLLNAKVSEYESAVIMGNEEKKFETRGAIFALLELLESIAHLDDETLKELGGIRNGPLILDQIFPRIERLVGKRE